MTDEILRVDDLVVEFPQSGWRTPPFRALKGVSVAVGAGETLGIVGESGSGKSTLGRAVLGLAPVTSGTVTYEGRDISHLSRRRRRELGNDIQVVFQDPYTSLNPSLTIGDTLSEPLTQAGIAGAEARRRVKDLLDRVGMPADSVQRLPKEFSGGQRQRIAIARPHST
jgi:peptide/nickel transport system ATP-binding protein